MEKEGLRWSLNYLLEQDVSINTIATDRYRGVGALMKTEYPYITHQYDVWHMAKSVVKQLTWKGDLKHCERLQGHVNIQYKLWYIMNGINTATVTKIWPVHVCILLS